MRCKARTCDGCDECGALCTLATQAAQPRVRRSSGESAQAASARRAGPKARCEFTLLDRYAAESHQHGTPHDHHARQCTRPDAGDTVDKPIACSQRSARTFHRLSETAQKPHFGMRAARTRAARILSRGAGRVNKTFYLLLQRRRIRNCRPRINRPQNRSNVGCTPHSPAASRRVR